MTTTLSHDDLLDEGARLTELLASAHRELADLRVGELTAKRESWLNSTETSVSGRERDVTFNTIDLTGDVIKLQGEILALAVELSDVDRQLTYMPRYRVVYPAGDLR